MSKLFSLTLSALLLSTAGAAYAAVPTAHGHLARVHSRVHRVAAHDTTTRTPGVTMSPLGTVTPAVTPAVTPVTAPPVAAGAVAAPKTGTVVAAPVPAKTPTTKVN